MLTNVVIDLVANFSLVFSSTGERFEQTYWVLIGEDPISGQPFMLCGGPHDTFEKASREAWKCIVNGGWFVVRPAVEGLPSVTDVWRRAFGPGFSDVIKFVETGQGQIPGMALLRWSQFGKAL